MQLKAAGLRLPRVLPRSSVQLLAAPRAAHTSVDLVFGRDDWSTGRDLGSEEARCGILLRLGDVGSVPRVAAGGQSSGRLSAPTQRLCAVIKAQTSDFQVTEVDAQGNGAFLEKVPKGRWRKISRPKTLLVENSTTPFSHADKSFSPRVVSHGEYVRRVGKLPPGKPLLQFVMYRDGYTMESVLNRFRYEAAVDVDAVHFRQGKTPGGSFGCLTQFGCCVGVTREQLPHVSRHYNLHPLLMDPRRYYGAEELSRLSAPPGAFLYRVLLRCVDGDKDAVLASLRTWSADGFVNYFGVEKFGLSDNSLFHLAAMVRQGDYRGALGCYLQSLAESNSFHGKHFLSYVNAEPSTAASAVGEWAAASKAIKCPRSVQLVIRGLQKYHSCPTAEEGDRLLKELWQTTGVEAAATQSAAEFVWNAMATQRLLTAGRAVVVGDIVRVKREADEPSGPERYATVLSEEDASRFSIADVVLPVPYLHSSLVGVWGQQSNGGPVPRSLFEEFASKHKLDFLFGARTEGAQARGAEHVPQLVYRPVVSRPAKVQASVIYDPSSLASLKTDLFLLQERKAVETLELDYAARVREPSLYNVSERFVERMSAVHRQHQGSNSVALSFLLPAECSPLVALREVFALKYPNFADLYFSA